MRLEKKYRVLGYLIPLLILFCIPSSRVHAKVYTYNVKNYGAKGNGKTDDRNAIQSVLKKAATLKDEDSIKVIVPAGTYNIGKVLEVYSNTTISLDENAVIYRTNMQYPLLMNVGKSGSKLDAGKYDLSKNITLEGGTWDGGDIKNTNNMTNNINIAHATNVTIQNTTIRNNFGAHLVELSGVNNAKILNTTFYGFAFAESVSDELTAKEAIQLDYTYNGAADAEWCPGYKSDKTPCKNIVIEGNTFKEYPRGVGNHHGVDAIPGVYTENVTITNNTFTNMYGTSTKNGKKVYGQAILLHSFKNANVNNNVIKNAEGGIMALFSKELTIEKNSITTTKENGITFVEKAQASKIKSNKVTNAGKHGISILKKSTVTEVASNTIKASGVKQALSNGITVDGGSTVTRINSNTVESSKQHAISLVGGANVTSIYKNTIKNNVQNGISLGGASSISKLYTNKIESNKQHGISLVGKSKVTSIYDNTITKNNQNGISIAGSSTISKLYKNKIESNKQHGISLVTKGKITSLYSNVVSKNSKNGVSIAGSAAITNIYDTKMESNKQHGISMIENAKIGSMYTNTISKNSKNGVSAASGSVITKLYSNKIESNKQHGISLVDKAKATSIYKNTIKSSGKNGVSVSNSSSADKVYENTISGNKQHGISLINKVTVKQITKNTISKNNNHGISVSEKSKVTEITGNKISGCVKGKTISVSTGAKVTKKQK